LFDLVSGVRGLLFACILQVWSNCSTLSVESGDCFSCVCCMSGAILWPCQWSPVLVICLYFAGLEQSPDPVSGVLRLLLACISQVWSNLSTLPSDCYSFVFCRSGAIVRPCQCCGDCYLLVFCRSSNYLTLSVESGDSYSLVFCIVWSNCLTLSVDSGDCRSGAIIRPCQWSPVFVICFYCVDLKQLFDHVSGVRWLVLARICSGLEK
jgi:hypothetical protein